MSAARTAEPSEYRIPGRNLNVYVSPPLVGVGMETAASVAVSSRDTVPSRLLATHTESDDAATARGPFPTRIEPTTSLESGSIRETVPPVLSATHTAPRATATATGDPPTGMIFCT